MAISGCGLGVFAALLAKILKWRLTLATMAGATALCLYYLFRSVRLGKLEL